jgi:hypothetical protein
MQSLSHPRWCVRHEDGIHHSATRSTPATDTGLTAVDAHLWQLDEPHLLAGVALAFTLGEDIDSHLLDLGQADALALLLRDLLTVART